MKKGNKIYEGKAKILYSGPEKGTVIQHFKDDATAFNNLKKSNIDGKGILNNRISEHILSNLNKIGIKTHLIKRINMREQLIKLAEIYPVEFIVRNIVAGSLSKRLGIEEGTMLEKPLLEFCYKSDSLGDPLIAQEHIYAFDYVGVAELDEIKDACFRINDFLQGMFGAIGIKLVDFKLEFGKIKNDTGSIKEILLVDEISPDTCRLWDSTTDRRLDKDIFRKNLGSLIEGYQEVARRLGILHEHSNVSPIKFTKPTAVKLKKK